MAVHVLGQALGLSPAGLEASSSWPVGNSSASQSSGTEAVDTTVVTTTAIAAFAGLAGGLAGTAITTRNQQFNERTRQRERASEVLGLVGPLLTELDPDPMIMWLPGVKPGTPDPMIEMLAKLSERVREVGQQLSTVSGWWSTAHGSALALRLQGAFYQTRYWDGWVISDMRKGKDFGTSLKEAQRAWQSAITLADQLRVEIRGDATRARPFPRVGCAVPWYGGGR
jgi:hypothetical protein